MTSSPTPSENHKAAWSLKPNTRSVGAMVAEDKGFAEDKESWSAISISIRSNGRKEKVLTVNGRH
jgi:hypothetical protein